VLALLLAVCSGHAVADTSLPTLYVQHLIQPQSVQVTEFEAVAALLEKEKIARLVVNADKPTKGAARRLTEAVRIGKLDLAVVPLAALGSYVSSFRAFETPYLFNYDQKMIDVQFRSFVLHDESRRAGFEVVGWWPGEPLVLASNKPILEPYDLRGLRVASMSATDEASALTLFREKVGAIKMDLPPAQLVAEIKRGKIDVIETSLTGLRRFGPPELSITLTNHLYTGYVIIANPARWGRLPVKTQEDIRFQLRRAHDSAHKAVKIAVNNARQDLVQKFGVTLFEIPWKVRNMWSDELYSKPLMGALSKDFVVLLNKRLLTEAMASSKDRNGPEISWNAWFESGPESNPRDVDSLMVNGVYRINLDLARYWYKSAQYASLDMPITKLLEGQGERRLLLQPVLLGDQLATAPGNSLRPLELTVKLDRASVTAKDKDLLAAFDLGQLSTRALSREMNLGGLVSWDIKAQAVGCGGIAVTVWDQARVIPLDHIVLHVPVQADAKNHPENCKLAGTEKSMNAGLSTLLEGPVPIAGSRSPDAALHVFEDIDTGVRRSHAVFLHRKRLLAALADPNAKDPGIYSWQLASSLSTYVSDPSQLPDMIQSAHNAVAQPGINPFPYEGVATELALKVFSGAQPYDQAEAGKARAALREAVETALEPTVVVRLVSAAGETIFMPFALIAANSAEPELKKRFTVIQPLPYPHRSTSACIKDWYIARPRELQGVSSDARDLLRDAADAAPKSGIQVIGNHNTLAKFLTGTSTINRADGLIILAHHDKGYLKFNDTDRPPARIAQEYITRDFQSGSAAILAACTATGNSTETRAIVDRFVRQGVETLIVSPFAVDAEFGTRLALEFEKVVADELANHSGATLLQVFKRASKNVATAYQNQPALLDMALEFMLIGNPEVSLCP